MFFFFFFLVIGWSNGFNFAHTCLFVLALFSLQHLKITFELLSMVLSIYMFSQTEKKRKRHSSRSVGFRFKSSVSFSFKLLCARNFPAIISALFWVSEVIYSLLHYYISFLHIFLMCMSMHYLFFFCWNMSMHYHWRVSDDIGFES